MVSWTSLLTNSHNYNIKGISINCLLPLRDLERVAARHELKHNGCSILKSGQIVTLIVYICYNLLIIS